MNARVAVPLLLASLAAARGLRAQEALGDSAVRIQGTSVAYGRGGHRNNVPRRDLRARTARMAGSREAAPASSATADTIYLETVVWASKHNPEQQPVVAKFGEDYGFVPATVVVRQGDHVVIHLRNLESGGDDTHTFTIPGYGINQPLPPLGTATVSFTADSAGVFPFHCDVHKPWMSGTLIVLASR